MEYYGGESRDDVFKRMNSDLAVQLDLVGFVGRRCFTVKFSSLNLLKTKSSARHLEGTGDMDSLKEMG